MIWAANGGRTYQSLCGSFFSSVPPTGSYQPCSAGSFRAGSRMRFTVSTSHSTIPRAPPRSDSPVWSTNDYGGNPTRIGMLTPLGPTTILGAGTAAILARPQPTRPMQRHPASRDPHPLWTDQATERSDPPIPPMLTPPLPRDARRGEASRGIGTAWLPGSALIHDARALRRGSRMNTGIPADHLDRAWLLAFRAISGSPGGAPSAPSPYTADGPTDLIWARYRETRHRIASSHCATGPSPTQSMFGPPPPPPPPPPPRVPAGASCATGSARQQPKGDPHAGVLPWSVPTCPAARPHVAGAGNSGWVIPFSLQPSLGHPWKAFRPSPCRPPHPRLGQVFGCPAPAAGGAGPSVCAAA